MRNIPIDIARGLAIMVVIFWHIVGIHSPWTDGWVMPIFFVIMGVFYHHAPSFKMLLKKKSRTILIPHFIGSIPAFVILLYKTGLYNTMKTILNPYSCINPVSWFLVSMFFCYLIYWGVNQIARDKLYMRIILSLVISILGFYTSQIHLLGIRLVLPFFISTSFTVMAFIEIGHLINPYLFPKRCNIVAFDKAGGVNCKQNILLILLIMFILDVLLLHPSSGNMKWNSYNTNYPTFIISGIIGSLFILKMCDLLHSLLAWIAPLGRLSLLMLIFHMYIYDSISFMEVNVMISYISTIVLTLVMAYIIETKYPFVLGRF